MYKTLSRGSKSFNVIALQQLLNIAGKDLGINLTVDHDFGGITKDALQKVQKKIGISPSGICDILTWQALYRETKVNQLGLKNFVFGGLTEDQYNPEHQRKDIIVLHHTAGGPNPYYVRDHFQKKKSLVGTAFIIGGKGEYDGVALQIFKHPSQWAFHLNIWANFTVFEKQHKENKAHENWMAKRTVAVEVCNYGYLKYIDGGFWFMSRNRKAKRVDKEDVVDYGGEGYRGKRFYHKYTNKQIDSLYDFITKSAEYYNINIDKPKGGFCEKWFDYSWDAVRGKRNLLSHSSVRSKSDMHPQPELIDMLNSL